MPIFQSFLNTEIGSKSVPRPQDNFAGVGAIAGAVDSLAKLGGTIIEAVGESNEQEAEGTYLSVIEQARALKLQGRHEEARQLVRQGTVAFARAGGNPHHEKFEGTRELFGLSENYLADPFDLIREQMLGEGKFREFVFAEFQKAYEAAGENVDAIDKDAVLNAAIKRRMAYESRVAISRDEALTAEEKFNAAITNVNDDIANALEVAFGYMKENDFIDSATVESIEASIVQGKQNFLAELERNMGAPLTPEQRAMVDKRFEDAMEVIKNLKKMSTFEALSNELKIKQFKYLTALAADPTDKFGITPLDFNNWLLSEDGVDKATLIAQNAAAGEDFVKSLERVGAALTEMFDLTKFPQERSNADFSGRRPLDTVVDRENRLQDAIAQRVSNSKSVKEWGEILDIISPSVNGDPSTAKNINRAKEVAVTVGVAAELVSRIGREGNWVDGANMKKLLTPKLMEYLKVIAKEHPEIYFDMVDHLQATNQGYATEIEARLGRLRGEYGFTWDEDAGWQIDKAYIADNKVYGEDSNEVLMVVSDFASKVLGIANPDDAFIKMVSDDRSWAIVQGRVRGESFVDGENAAILRRGIEHIRDSRTNFKPKDFQAMISGRKELSKFTVDSTNLAVRDMPIRRVSKADVGRYSALLPGIDRGEGAGSYDTLWGRWELSGRKFAGTKITDMSVGYILDTFTATGSEYRRQATEDARRKIEGYDGSTAPLGRYQIVPATLRSYMSAAGVTRDHLFNEQVQDALFVAIMDDLVNKASSRAELIRMIKSTWPGVKTADAQHFVNEYFGEETANAE